MTSQSQSLTWFSNRLVSTTHLAMVPGDSQQLSSVSSVHAQHSPHPSGSGLKDHKTSRKFKTGFFSWELSGKAR